MTSQLTCIHDVLMSYSHISVVTKPPKFRDETSTFLGRNLHGTKPPVFNCFTYLLDLGCYFGEVISI